MPRLRCDVPAAERLARDSDENRKRRAEAKAARDAEKAAQEAHRKEKELRSYS